MVWITGRTSGGFISRKSDIWYPPNIYTQFVWWQRFPHIQNALVAYKHARFARTQSLGIWDNPGEFIGNLIESLVIADKYKLRRYVGNVQYKYEYYMQYFKARVLKTLQRFLSEYGVAALVMIALTDCAGRGGWSADNRMSFGFPRIEGKDPIDVWRVIEEMRKFMADTLGNMAFLEAFEKYFEQPRLYRSDNEDGLVEEGFQTSVSQYPIYERVGKRKDVGDLTQLVEGVLWKWFAGHFKSEAATWQRLDECGRHYVLCRAADRWSYDEKWLLRCSQATGEETVKRQWQSARWMLPPSCPENEALVDALVELGRAAQAARDKLEDEKEAAKELGYIEKRCAEEVAKIGYAPPSVLDPRVLSLQEIEAIKQACALSLSQADAQTQSVVATINEFVAFCGLLLLPENQILVPSGNISKSRSIPVLSRIWSMKCARIDRIAQV